jgi:hypothetical protein
VRRERETGRREREIDREREAEPVEREVVVAIRGLGVFRRVSGGQMDAPVCAVDLRASEKGGRQGGRQSE